MSDHILNDVIPDILRRLSLDSLMRFRFVSKPWRDLIDVMRISKFIAIKGNTLYSFDWVNEHGSSSQYNATNEKKIQGPSDFQITKHGLETLGSPNGMGIFIYSLKLNSWRELTNVAIPFELGDRYLPSDCAFVNGAFHWFVERKTNPDDFIVSFVLASEEFRKMSHQGVPQMLQEGYYHAYRKSLCSLNGRLCCLVLGMRTMNLWVMKSYGVGSFWTMLISIPIASLPASYVSQSYFRLVALLCKENGKKLMLLRVGDQCGWQKLGIYDLDGKSMKDVFIDGLVQLHV
ncbi:OLC1v1008674C1 [Oldenlandia corymbosa var. corymbosa]|uniref:OLC1v1008674C1 n=1 Tax=Oldenlandia corymbosa var. corymbosa TaxID=529605 RepID=A0AAV1DMI7_OLDCO|nr:OLC1v1008674C1 [Oldenlandia corymbosa var. corymbosa]